MKQIVKGYDIGADVVRITAGALVLLIHSTDRYLGYSFLSAGISGDILRTFNIFGKVAVPLFVILSGYLLLKEEKVKSPSLFFKKRFSNITIPFIVWVIIYFWWMGYWGHYTITPFFVIETIFRAAFIHLYFIPLIAFLYLLTPFLATFLFSKSQRQQYIICGLLLLAGLLFHLISYFLPFLSLDKTIFTVGVPYIGYYVFGAIARKIVLPIKAKVFAFVLLIASVTISFTLRRNDLDSYFSHTLSPFVMIVSLTLFLLILSLSNDVKRIVSLSQTKVLQYIASTIFGIYLIHVIVLDVVGDKIAVFNPFTIHSPIAFYAILYFMASFVISFILVSIGKMVPGVKRIF